MLSFEYTAKDSSGKIYKGTLEATDEEIVRRRLKDSGFYLTSIKIKKESLFSRVSTRVNPDDLVVFSQQFSGMLGAGLPLIRCLEALQKQTESPTLKRVIKEARLDIEGGFSLSDALAKHPKVFSDFFLSLIRAGEKGGVIDKVLERLAKHLESQQDLLRRVRSAFAYPVIVGVLAFLVMIFLVMVIVPVFKDVYAKINVVLPGPTLALVAISNFTREFWWVILLFTGGIIAAYHRIKDIPRARKQVDGFKIKAPIFGRLIRQTAVSRFIRTFGDMLASGVSILEAIDVAGKVTGNMSISELIEKMRDSVRRGGRVTDVLQEQEIFPPSVVQMIAAGEESGILPVMLQKSADALDKEVDITIKRLIIKVEPLLTMLLAAFVGFIAIAIYMPMFDLIRQISVG